MQQNSSENFIDTKSIAFIMKIVFREKSSLSIEGFREYLEENTEIINIKIKEKIYRMHYFTEKFSTLFSTEGLPRILENGDIK